MIVNRKRKKELTYMLHRVVHILEDDLIGFYSPYKGKHEQRSGIKDKKVFLEMISNLFREFKFCLITKQIESLYDNAPIVIWCEYFHLLFHWLKFRNFLARYHNWDNKNIINISDINPHLGFINSTTTSHKINSSDSNLSPDLSFVQAFSTLFADIMLKKEIGFKLFKRCNNKNCQRVFVATRPKSVYCSPRCGGRENDRKYPRAARGTKEYDTYKRKRMLQSKKYHLSRKG